MLSLFTHFPALTQIPELLQHHTHTHTHCSSLRLQLGPRRPPLPPPAADGGAPHREGEQRVTSCCNYAPVCSVCNVCSVCDVCHVFRGWGIMSLVCDDWSRAEQQACGTQTQEVIRDAALHTFSASSVKTLT